LSAEVSRVAVLRKDAPAVRTVPADRPKVPVQEVPVDFPEPEGDYCKVTPGMVYLDGMDKSGSWVAERQARMFATFDYLRDIIDSSPYGTVVLNEQRQIVFFNRAMYALTGPLEGRLLVGTRWGEALNCRRAVENEGCGIDDACRTCGAFLAIGEAIDGWYGTRECRFTQNVDGRTEWLDLSIGVSPAVVGDERFLVCSVRDISNEKRKAVLERIFFHDLLNNLLAVDLLAHALKTMVAGDASTFAQQISACANQLVDEIESQQLLIAAEKEELAVKPVALSTGAFISSIVERYRLHRVAEGRTIEIDGDSIDGLRHDDGHRHDVAMYTDGSILRRVLENMVKNALEASKAGETVRIGCRDLGQEVEFWTNNSGLMAETVQVQVFQRSFSTKGAGRGLGTYGMKLLSERYLKGEVTFRSTAAEGTTFIARYPKSLTHAGLAQLRPGPAEAAYVVN
jgi:signal transduction histidine kinase